MGHEQGHPDNESSPCKEAHPRPRRNNRWRWLHRRTPRWIQKNGSRPAYLNTWINRRRATCSRNNQKASQRRFRHRSAIHRMVDWPIHVLDSQQRCPLEEKEPTLELWSITARRTNSRRIRGRDTRRSNKRARRKPLPSTKKAIHLPISIQPR